MHRTDHLKYALYFVFPDASADKAARAVIDWTAAFGVQKLVICDGPTITRTRQFILFPKVYKFHNTLPVLFPPEVTGSSSGLGKKLLCVFKPITYELGRRPEDFHNLLPLLRRALS